MRLNFSRKKFASRFMILLLSSSVVANAVLLFNIVSYKNNIEQINRKLNDIQNENTRINRIIEKNKNTINDLMDQLDIKEKEIKGLKQQNDELKAKYGHLIGAKKIKAVVTAYTLAYDECGKRPGSRGYGITASGARAKYFHTIAVNPKKIPLGSKVYIPYFRHWPNKGIFVAQDTGSGKFDIDVLMITKSEANKFGRRQLDVYILK